VKQGLYQAPAAEQEEAATKSERQDIDILASVEGTLSPGYLPVAPGEPLPRYVIRL
jgi:hypothetical protein